LGPDNATDVGTTVTAVNCTAQHCSGLSDSGSGFGANSYLYYHYTADAEL